MTVIVTLEEIWDVLSLCVCLFSNDVMRIFALRLHRGVYFYFALDCVGFVSSPC